MRRSLNLGIYGVGVLGCSIALRYRALHPDSTIVGCDALPEHLAFARECGALSEATDDLRTLATRADVLILATPPEHIVHALAQLTELRATTDLPQLILDVASVKSRISAAGANLAGFVATHPMAGTATSGPEMARADLFVDRPWAYVPSQDAASNTRTVAFISEMGARALAIDAESHDRLVARTSHLPQTLSTVLALQIARESTHGLFGQGLLDMLRLAGSSDTIWSDIYTDNAEAIASELDAYGEALRGFAEIVRRRDRVALGEAFRRANASVASTR